MDFFEEFKNYCTNPDIKSGKAQSYSKAIKYLCDYLKIYPHDSKSIKHLIDYQKYIKDKNSSEHKKLLSYLSAKGHPSYLTDGYISAAFSPLKRFCSSYLTTEPEDLNTKWTNFLKKYTEDYIQNEMTIDDYVIGHGSTNKSFCYYVENELNDLVNIHGSTSIKFGLYYGKTKSDPIIKYRFSAKFGKTIDEAFFNIKQELLKVIKHAKTLTEFKDIKSTLSPMFKYKIMFLYNDKIMIPICSIEHCKYFCKQLNFTNIKSFENCQEQLLRYKQEKFPLFNNHQFMQYLYNNFPKIKQKDNKKINIIATDKKVINETPDEIKSEELFLKSIYDKDIQVKYDITKLKQILPTSDNSVHNYNEKKFGGTVKESSRKVYSGRKAEKFFMDYLSYNNFIKDKDFYDVANNKDFSYDVKFKNLGLEIKNIKSGSFYLTDNEISLLLKHKTHLILVDVDNGIWLVKNNSKWLNNIIKQIMEIRAYSNQIYPNLDLTDIKININENQIHDSIIDISKYSKNELIKILK